MNKLFNDVFKVNQKIEDGLAEEKEEEEEPKDEIMQAARHVEKVVNMKGTRAQDLSSLPITHCALHERSGLTRSIAVLFCRLRWLVGARHRDQR